MWLMKLVLFFLLTFSAFASDKISEESNAPAAPAISDQEIYNRTLELCVHFPLTDQLKIIMKSGFESFWDYNTSEMSFEVKQLVTHPMFKQAMRECYGENQTKKDMFLMWLGVYDVIGKAIGQSLQILSWDAATHIAHKTWNWAGRAWKWLGRTISVTLYGYVFKDVALEGYHAATAPRGIYSPEALAANPALKEAYEEYKAGKITEDQIGDRFSENLRGYLTQMSDALGQATLAMLNQRIKELEAQLVEAKQENNADRIKTIEDKIKMLEKMREEQLNPPAESLEEDELQQAPESLTPAVPLK